MSPAFYKVSPRYLISCISYQNVLKVKLWKKNYESFVRSKLEYACIIWDDCSEQDRLALEKCQLRAARIVTEAKKGTSHSKLYMETQWPQLHERRGNSKLCLMHKVVNIIAPSYLVEMLSNAVNIDKQFKLRKDDDLDQFQFRTEKFKKSLFPYCVRKWNSLERDLRKECFSCNSFRSKITLILKLSGAVLCRSAEI